MNENDVSIINNSQIVMKWIRKFRINEKFPHPNVNIQREKLSMKSLLCSRTPSFADFVITMRGESRNQQKKVEDYMTKLVVKRKKLMKMMEISPMRCHYVMQVGCHQTSIEN